jgi:hypothetical protein
MDKYDFIAGLLENKKLNTSQKERVLLLSAQELKSKSIKDEELLRRIEEIEIKFEKYNEESETQIDGNINEKKQLNGPNPKHVAEFMSLFNKRDGLKYLTHDFDENSAFEIDKFLISANNVFIKKTRELSIPKSLWRIVKQFAFDSKQTEWTSISEDYKKTIPVKIGWATKELRDWSKSNQIHPIRNNDYKKIINDFKRITRIDAPNLEKLIDNTIDGCFEEELSSFNISKTALTKADFYSHVGFLKSALETIFEEIKKQSNTPEKKKISIKYERAISNDDYYYLRKVLITHHKSYPTKELKLLLKEWNEKGNMGKIKEKLMGYCHWSIETIIEETPTRVNILRDGETPEYEIIESNLDGFTHVLTFYYK